MNDLEKAATLILLNACFACGSWDKLSSESTISPSSRSRSSSAEWHLLETKFFMSILRIFATSRTASKSEQASVQPVVRRSTRCFTDVEEQSGMIMTGSTVFIRRELMRSLRKGHKISILLGIFRGSPPTTNFASLVTDALKELRASPTSLNRSSSKEQKLIIILLEIRIWKILL